MFRIRETDHFVIAFDTPYPELQALIGRLEGTYKVVMKFCDALQLDVQPLEQPLGVIFHDRAEAFDGFMKDVGVNAQGIAGLYEPRSNLAAFCSTRANPAMQPVNQRIEQLQEQFHKAQAGRRGQVRRQLQAFQVQRDAIVERFNRLVIQHEAAHQILFNIGVHPRGARAPRWLVEGLACQFEVPQPRLERGKLQVNHVRLFDLRDALGLDDNVRTLTETQYEAAFTAGRMLPLRDLIGHDGLFSSAGTELTVRYAQAWSLVYFLQAHHREGFTGYLRALARREPGAPVSDDEEVTAFESHLGPLDDASQLRWLESTVQLKLDPRRAGR
jgi:hypothetical protein